MNTHFSLVVYLQAAIKTAIHSVSLSHILSLPVATKQSVPQGELDQPANQTENYPTEKASLLIRVTM